MAHVKEPRGVDFIIESEPLTNEARQEISEFIRNYKSISTSKVSRLKVKSSKRLKTVRA